MTGKGVGRSQETFLAGGGEMGERIRAFDWSATSLGTPDRWPQSLRSAVSILLPSRAQICLFWGADLVAIYNDAYRPALGIKHPHALGQPAREVWKEFWADVLRPLLEGVVRTGEAFWGSDYPFFLERLGYPEETYFDISYDPVRDESGAVGGVFCIVSETTGRVIGERRLRTLRDLGRLSSEARSIEEAFTRAAQVLATAPRDLPFALLYARTPLGAIEHVAGCGIEPMPPDAWPLAEVARTRQAIRLEGQALATYGALPGTPWPEPVRAVTILPIAVADQEPIGFLVVGTSPRLPLDEIYSDFLRLVASSIAATANAARALAEERRRAEALAEIDRVKTTFFSNVSHEFRTPLTLMLGPLEDLLAGHASPLAETERETLDLVHRNGLRLLRLVNTLLDFSRIEAGRVEASYELTDLAAFTAQLASVFQSAIERAGLRFTVACDTITAPTYVDRDMWEKIVVNLLSNALKYTLAGEIEVRLRQEENHAVLCIRDTGVGIPESELPRLFERFYRVKGTQGRTHEGTGIGLALVQELTRLHGGSVQVTSAPSGGSTFCVRLPIGRSHLPAERVNAVRSLASTALGARPYVEEALRWIPGAGPELALEDVILDHGLVTPTAGRDGVRPRVLVVDDNMDMRDYLRRLLTGRYEVAVASDGEEALRSLREQRPDLVLSDVMMPRLDGIGLLRAIRAEPSFASLPVVLLSARIGEEASVEGLEAGADDYLTKPFSARELLARVHANLEMARLRHEVARRESELRSETEDLRARLGTLLEQIPVGVIAADAAGQVILANDQAVQLLRHPIVYAENIEDYRQYRARHADGRPFAPEDYPLLRSAIHGEIIRDQEVEYLLGDGAPATLLVSSSPVRDKDGTILAAIATFSDISERKRIEQALRDSEAQFRRLADAMPQLVWMAQPDGWIFWYNRRWYEYTGTTPKQMEGWGWQAVHDPATLPSVLERWQGAIATGTPFDMTFPIRGADGVFRPFLTRVVPVHDGTGKLVRWFGTNTDVTAQRTAEDALREMNERLEQRIAERTAALRESEGRFRLLVEGIIDYAIFMLDAHGHVTNWNAGAERIHGYAAAEIIGEHFSRFYTAEDRREGKAEAALETAARLGKFEVESWRVRKDGSRFWANVVIDALRDDDGKLIGFAKITRDMTERRAVEERLRQSQRLEAIGQLTGGVAHDFNNLLSVIFGNLETLLRRLPADDDGDLRRFAEAASRGAARAARLTQQLLAFSRRQPLEPKPINLNRLVVEASELLQRSLGEQVELETVLGAGLWWVQADAAELENALLNLAVNARDAMPRGGKLTIETANTHLDEGYVAEHDGLAPGQYVMLAVSDTGTGMATETVAKAFEPFFTTKPVGQGTGLGLSQVYGFIKQSGGHVKIYSELGHGTSVKLYLPRLRTGAGNDTVASESVVLPKAAPDETILVVEDDADVRTHSTEILRELGYRVIGVPDGASALRVLAQDAGVRLMFTDVGLPGGLNGRQLADEARRLHPGLKVLFTTGYAKNAIVHQGRLDPGVELVMKPFTYAALATKIRKVLDSSGQM